MFFHLLEGELVLLLEGCFLSHSLEVGQFLEVFILACKSSRFRVECCRVHIEIEEILGSVFPISDSAQSLELLLLIGGGEGGCDERIIRNSHFLIHVISLHFLPHFFILFVVIDDLPIHFRRVAVPPVPLYFPVHPHILDHIVGCDVFVGVFGAGFPGAFSALLAVVSHGSAVFAGALAVGGRLLSTLASVVPILDESLRLHGRDLDQLSAALGVLSVPGKLLYELGSILLFLHTLIMLLLHCTESKPTLLIGKFTTHLKTQGGQDVQSIIEYI